MSHTHDHEHSHQNPGHQNHGENNPSQPRMSDTRSEAAIAHQEKFPRPEKDQPGGALLRSYIAYDQGPNGDTLLAFGSDFLAPSSTFRWRPVAHRGL
ncbi:hypothetical protein [Pseudoglutamicibacter albus]|uniref:hypothetical protein n=1 Tax=Pseudoglutamicibacter albus TaxID=98671 RepID=UPI003607FB54